MKVETFACVWDALADTPAEAANLCLRSTLLMGIGERIKTWDVPQGAAAARLGVTRPRLNDLLRGKLNKFRSTRWSISPAPPASRSRSG